MSGRLLRPLLLAVGLAVVAWLVWDLGPATVWEAIHTLSWRLGLVVFFPFCLAIAFDTLGWRVLLPSAASRGGRSPRRAWRGKRSIS